MWIAIACVNLATAVMLGAFGAHGLKNKLTEAQLAWWSTATEYFFYHALGLLLVGMLVQLKVVHSPLSAIILQMGIFFFCGSLYAMALGAPRWFGAITPIGGLFFISGWLVLAYQSSRISV